MVDPFEVKQMFDIAEESAQCQDPAKKQMASVAVLAVFFMRAFPLYPTDLLEGLKVKLGPAAAADRPVEHLC